MSIVEACESRTNTTPDFPMGWYTVGRSHELQIGDVTNVTAFGAFVDVGAHRDGLVHISKLADRFVQYCTKQI